MTDVKKVLLVEDNARDELLTLRALQKTHKPYKTQVARDGAEALEYLFHSGKYDGIPDGTPNLILLDLKLPKIDGLEVLRQIRSNAKTEFIPVVILTSSIEDNDVIESFRRRANSYVRKQVDFIHFAEVVKQMVHYWLDINENAPIRSAKSKEVE